MSAPNVARAGDDQNGDDQNDDDHDEAVQGKSEAASSKSEAEKMSNQTGDSRTSRCYRRLLYKVVLPERSHGGHFLVAAASRFGARKKVAADDDLRHSLSLAHLHCRPIYIISLKFRSFASAASGHDDGHCRRSLSAHLAR